MVEDGLEQLVFLVPLRQGTSRIASSAADEGGAAAAPRFEHVGVLWTGETGAMGRGRAQGRGKSKVSREGAVGRRAPGRRAPLPAHSTRADAPARARTARSQSAPRPGSRGAAAGS